MTWVADEDVGALLDAARAYEARTGDRVVHLAAARLGNTLLHTRAPPLRFWMVVAAGEGRARPIVDEIGLGLPTGCGALLDAPANTTFRDALLERTAAHMPKTLAYQLLYYRHALSPVISDAAVVSLQDSVRARIQQCSGAEAITHVAGIASCEAYRYGRDAMHYVRHHQQDHFGAAPRADYVRALCAHFAVNASLALHLRDGSDPGSGLHPEVSEVFGRTDLRGILEHGTGVPATWAAAERFNRARHAMWLGVRLAKPVSSPVVSATPVKLPVAFAIP